MLTRTPELALLRAALALGAVALSSSWATPVVAAPSDADQPIHIRADSAELDEKRGLAIYRGSVQMDQGTMQVTADTMTIEIADEQVVRITAQGSPSHYRQLLETDEPEVLADANTIVYHTQEERVELKGNARLRQDPNEFSGELIQYDIRARKVDASSLGSGGVRMTFKPPPAAAER
jgi:lipopolysaccharide export system protein LptA